MEDVLEVESSTETKRFVSFVATGGIAAAANIGMRYVLSLFVNYEVAVALAYLVGMTVAFVLARQFVFSASGRGAATEYGRFALVNVASFLQVWVVSVGLARVVFPSAHFEWHADDIAHVIGVASPILLSYYLHKHFSFGRR